MIPQSSKLNTNNTLHLGMGPGKQGAALLMRIFLVRQHCLCGYSLLGIPQLMPVTINSITAGARSCASRCCLLFYLVSSFRFAYVKRVGAESKLKPKLCG